ncbi:dicarboxylate/amino acid:cation symporter [Leucobacter weissii]|uniref:L-cystine uptake protein TcyP n=1 Tax=Leucobacter weissii TaxID=1983706 RepID=A0A939SBG3_9MICO|nr:dicarboxylate/amino acid:cation symporter [Leucobacter weissii]MBO1901348.1 dicarboxylate/amino acid:cation symporter [Leucobacter weissii]
MESFDWSGVIALAVAVAASAGIFVLRRRRIANLSVLIIVALFLGVGIGIVFRDHLDLITPAGDIYVRIISAVVAPLIIVSILSSVTSLGNIAKLRSIGVSSVFWLLLTNLIAIFLTLGLALFFQVGKGFDPQLEGVDGSGYTELVTPLDQVIVGFFPSNVVGDIASNSIIPIIVTSLVLAVAYLAVASKKGEETVRPFKDFVDAVKLVLFKAVGFIIELTPYAVLVIIADSAARVTASIETVWAYFSVVLLAFVASFASAYLVNGVLLRVWADVSPSAFFKKLTAAQYTAFTTQSSIGTLPLTTSALVRKVGVSEDVANFTAPLGTTIGMPGCAGVWPILVAIFGVNALGIDYGFQDYVVLVVLGLLVSLGTAGVPGTALITATAVVSAVGLPVEIVVLLVPVNALVGTVSTMANVSAAATAAAIVGRRQNELDDDIFTERAVYDEDPPEGGAEATRPLDQRVVAGAAAGSAAFVAATGGAAAGDGADIRPRHGLGGESDETAPTAVLDRPSAEQKYTAPTGQCEI